MAEPPPKKSPSPATAAKPPASSTGQHVGGKSASPSPQASVSREGSSKASPATGSSPPPQPPRPGAPAGTKTAVARRSSAGGSPAGVPSASTAAGAAANAAKDIGGSSSEVDDRGVAGAAKRSEAAEIRGGPATDGGTAAAAPIELKILPAVPVAPSMTFPAGPSGNAFNPTEAFKVLNDLEARLRHCEELLGGEGGAYLNLFTGDDGDKDLHDDEDDDGYGGGGAGLSARTANSMTTGGDDKERDGGAASSKDLAWKAEVRACLQAAPVLSQLKQMKKLVDGLYIGKLADFEKKYNTLLAWLEMEHATISQLILNVNAKRTFILAHEKMLRDTADQLKQFDELKEFVNPPTLTDLAANKERLMRLELRGAQLSEEAIQLSEQMTNLARVHSSTMKIVYCLLSDWSDRVAAAKQARSEKIPKAKLGRRRSVGFGDTPSPKE